MSYLSRFNPFIRRPVEAQNKPAEEEAVTASERVETEDHTQASSSRSASSGRGCLTGIALAALSTVGGGAYMGHEGIKSFAHRTHLKMDSVFERLIYALKDTGLSKVKTKFEKLIAKDKFFGGKEIQKDLEEYFLLEDLSAKEKFMTLYRLGREIKLLHKENKDEINGDTFDTASFFGKFKKQVDDSAKSFFEIKRSKSHDSLYDALVVLTAVDRIIYEQSHDAFAAMTDAERKEVLKELGGDNFNDVVSVRKVYNTLLVKEPKRVGGGALSYQFKEYLKTLGSVQLERDFPQTRVVGNRYSHEPKRKDVVMEYYYKHDPDLIKIEKDSKYDFFRLNRGKIKTSKDTYDLWFENDFLSQPRYKLGCDFRPAYLKCAMPLLEKGLPVFASSDLGLDDKQYLKISIGKVKVAKTHAYEGKFKSIRKVAGFIYIRKDKAKENKALVDQLIQDCNSRDS